MKQLILIALLAVPDTIAAIDKENARRTAFEEELDKVVTVKNIRKISRLNPAGEPSIKGTSSKALAFIMKIDPLFADDAELETARPDTEQKKKK